jgi:hypothetical protein
MLASCASGSYSAIARPISAQSITGGASRDDRPQSLARSRTIRSSSARRSILTLPTYIGLVLSENTTGDERRLGAITKTGSRHARRLLIESTWHYRKRPAVGATLAARQDSLAIAWSAQQRLHRTWQRLAQRGKRRTIAAVAVAVARELASALRSEFPAHRASAGGVRLASLALSLYAVGVLSRPRDA